MGTRSASAAGSTTARVEAGAASSTKPLLPLQPAAPAPLGEAELAFGALDRIAPLVEDAIARKLLPGAVVLVGRRDTLLYERAFGHRAVLPAREPMTLDTIFDLASLTKVVGTTPATMVLVEQGALRLDDSVASLLPDCKALDKVTVRHLLTHSSGMPAGLKRETPWTGADVALAKSCAEKPRTTPGEQFAYSDVNFILLGAIVAKVSGMPLERFVAERVFGPLGMTETGYRPPADRIPRIAPTDFGDPGTGEVELLRGTLHDPTGRRMSGVAGHAGLFGTAHDLSRFCRMLLGGGAIDGLRLLSPLTVARMTTPVLVPDGSVRALGWDIESSLSGNRGDLFPFGSFGHTGFTGPSLWIDPWSGLYLVFLSNRVHPDGRGDVKSLRARLANVVASTLLTAAPAPRRPQPLLTAGAQARRASALEPRPSGPSLVATGLDVLRAEGFARLRGRKIAVLTNQAGRGRDGAGLVELLAKSPQVTLNALFSPEHGFRGELDEKVPDGTDVLTKLPIFSLYGEHKRPTDKMLEGIETLVVDLQDVGARFYTYMTTLAWAMEECGRRGISVVVLDRPNPITGSRPEGPLLDDDQQGFTGYFRMPIRHGLTLGELARLFVAERKLGVDLGVVEMVGWRRTSWYDETGLPWVNPSPNMRTMNAATLYPGLGAIEGSALSVGRGTDTPFELVGAPWIDGSRLAWELNARGLEGARFYPVSFTPRSSRHANEPCRGVAIVVTDRERLRPVRLGLELAAAIHRLWPRQFKLEELSQPLFGSARTHARLLAGHDPAAIAEEWRSGEEAWWKLAERYLIYREP